MKRLLAIILTIAMIMSMAISVSAAEINSVNVSNPQKTADNKNIAFTLPTAMASGETAVVHIMGTTDTDFRVWLGSLYNSASDIAYMIKDGNNFDFAAELTTTGSATTVTLKTLNSWDSSATANSLSTLEGVTVTTLEVFYGTMDEYNAFLTTPDDTDVTAHFECAVIYDKDMDGYHKITIYTEFVIDSGCSASDITLKLVSEDGTVLTKTSRNPEGRVDATTGKFEYPAGQFLGNSIYAYDESGELSDGWLMDTWTPDANNAPYAVELWVDDVKVAEKVISTTYDWSTSDANGVEIVGNAPAQDTTAPTYTGYFTTGDETHAMIIGGAIITSNHVYNANGDCVYCGYHKDVVEDEVVIETPVESDTEEVDEDNTDDVEVDDKTEDTNPTTGVVLAIAPMAMAALAVVASKRR